MEIDHIGVVVTDIEEAFERYIHCYGYKSQKNIFFDTSRRIRLALLVSSNNFRVELIQPIDEKSPSYDFMKQGGGIHHICYRVRDIEKTIDDLRKEEHLFFARPSEANLMDDQRVAFLFSKKDKQIIELIEISEK